MDQAKAALLAEVRTDHALSWANLDQVESMLVEMDMEPYRRLIKLSIDELTTDNLRDLQLFANYGIARLMALQIDRRLSKFD